jgi:hypothetical protein
MPVSRTTVASGLLTCFASAAVAGCGGSSSPATTPTTPAGGGTSASSNPIGSQTPVPAESNPPGDIPDHLNFVSYSNAAGGYRFTHPEGWASVVTGTDVRFTDKLNGVAASVVKASSAPTVASAKRDDVPRLQQSVPAFQLQSVTSVKLPAGSAVLIVYRRNTDPDPVTGRQYRDEVQSYEIWHNGSVVRFDLFGPVGADNVDAYRTMSQSLRLS